MAKNTLPEDFKDDILSESMNGRRRYQMISNADGTVSFVDVTEYSQVGSNFGQAQINATNVAVNESADKNKIIDSKEDLLANTQAGMMAGALAVKEIRSELNENLKDAAKKIVVLWTNPEWNSSTNLTPFVAQEIQIDNISDFDMIGICHSVYNNTRNYFNFFLNIFNKENNLTETFSEVKVTEYYVRLYYRKFIITQSGIKFDIGYSNSHTQVAANNSYAIPVKIIGIKF